MSRPAKLEVGEYVYPYGAPGRIGRITKVEERPQAPLTRRATPWVVTTATVRWLDGTATEETALQSAEALIEDNERKAASARARLEIARAKLEGLE